MRGQINCKIRDKNYEIIIKEEFCTNSQRFGVRSYHSLDDRIKIPVSLRLTYISSLNLYNIVKRTYARKSKIFDLWISTAIRIKDSVLGHKGGNDEIF